MEKYSEEFFRECGRKGGLKSASLKDREHFVMMGKKSAESRNKKKLKELQTEIKHYEVNDSGEIIE
jgi:general stress protein YciG